MSKKLQFGLTRSSRWRHVVLSAMWLAVFLSWTGLPLTAAPPDSPSSGPVADDRSPSSPDGLGGLEDRQQTATIAVYLLAGVMFIGVALLGMIVMWGHRVRRIARAPLPRETRIDETWYLRPDKTLDASTGAAESADDSDDETEVP